MRVTELSRATVVLAALAGVSPAFAPPPALAWETRVDAAGNSAALGVAATPDDGVVVVGSGDFIVAKLTRTTGQQVWRYTAGPPGYTAAVAVDPAGDVLAAGSVLVDPYRGLPQSFRVVKLSGMTGAELWRQDFSDPLAGSTGSAIDIALDTAGDVLVSGFVCDPGSCTAIVLELSGDTGTELWRYTGSPGTYADVSMSTVKLDLHGDVIAAATFAPAQGGLTVVKLSGASGAELWRSDLTGSVGLPGAAIAVGGSGDVALEGWAGDIPVGGPISVRDFVVMLSGTTGMELWRHDGGALETYPPAPRLALRPSGDVVASDVQFGIAVLRATDGHELWRQTIGCRSSDAVQALAVDGAGDVVAAGSAVGCVLDPSMSDYLQRDFTIAKLSGTNGVELWQRRYDVPEMLDTIFSATALAAIPTGDVIASGFMESVATGIEITFFTVRDFSDVDGALMVCGDGYVDVGEQCDDANPLNHGCCTGCRAASDGTSCSDENHCTTDDRCEQGTCAPGAPLPCEPCGTCDPEVGCRTDLPFACKTPTETGKASLRLGAGRRGGPATLRWEWRNGAATGKSEFGDPRTTTAYALCLYGNPSTDAPVMLRATAPAGGTCSRRHGCWRAAAKGFDYRSPTGSPDGLHAVTLREGGAGRARITVEGDGRHLVLPTLPLPLDPPLRVQLRKLDGSGPCWSATVGRVVRNRTHEFVARGN